MKMKRLILIFSLLTLAACGQPDNGAETPAVSVNESDQGPPYLVLDEELTQLKYDFNSTIGKVRLLFISGPTCGICLRGMADLNDAFIAAAQSDERLVTFVVHVPTLGATEKHAADTIPLLDGPRVHHYWEDSGIIGRHYEEVMDVDIYVWDFWAVYGPDASWDGALPPVPDYYEHQLGGFLDRPGGFPRDLLLDAKRFARVSNEYLDGVDARRYAKGAITGQSESELLADGTIIPNVSQPRNVAVRHHIIGRGGYKNLKRIQAAKMHGRLEVNGESFELTVATSRPGEVTRGVSVDGNLSVARRTSDGEIHIDTQNKRGLPAELETLLLESFEFDGHLVEWPDKGHKLEMSGMQKIGHSLAWKLELEQANGQRWNHFIDSHTGDLVKADALDIDNSVLYSILSSEFSEVSEIRFPHRVAYLDSTGNLLATEVFTSVDLDQDPLNPSTASMSD